MNKSSFGSHFTVTTWGESHGKALGAVIDGCPAGLSLSEEDIQKFLDRRETLTSAPVTTVILLILIVRDMQIIPLMRNMASVITVAVDDLQAVKQSNVLLPVQLHPVSLHHWVFRSAPTRNLSDRSLLKNLTLKK